MQHKEESLEQTVRVNQTISDKWNIYLEISVLYQGENRIILEKDF